MLFGCDFPKVGAWETVSTLQNRTATRARAQKVVVLKSDRGASCGLFLQCKNGFPSTHVVRVTPKQHPQWPFLRLC